MQMLQVQSEVAKPLLRPAFKLALVGQLGVATKLPLHKRLLSCMDYVAI